MSKEIYVVLEIATIISETFEDSYAIVKSKVAFASKEEADKYIEEQDNPPLLVTSTYPMEVREEKLVCLPVELRESESETNK